MIIGLELTGRGAVGVAVEADGTRLQRAESAAADAGAAAREVLRKLSSRGDAASAVGIATLEPEGDAANDLGDVAPASHRFATGTAGAAAEAWIGAARGERDVVYFAVADHAVAGILRDGAPPASTVQRAPAVAWLALNPVEREDYRKVGCLEAEVAGAGIVRRLIWRIKAGDQSRVLDAANGELSAITLDHVLDGARHGDGVAISVMRDTAKYLGMGAANLAAVVDPQVLVLGGIMATAADLLLDPVRTEMLRRLPPRIAQSLKIVPAALGADAPAIGAARLAAAGR